MKTLAIAKKYAKGGYIPQIGDLVHIIDDKSLMKGKSGIVLIKVSATENIVKVLDNGNERNVVVRTNGLQKISDDKMKTGGNIGDEINTLYTKSGFINSDFNWKLKLLEMLQDQSIEAYSIYQKLSKQQKEEVLQEQFEVDNDMGSDGDGDIETSKENLQILLEDAKNGKKYFKGGGVGNSYAKEDKEMLYSQTTQIKHHAEELHKVISKQTHIEPWVVSKMGRVTSDLSDVTHYLDGRTKMQTGGTADSAMSNDPMIGGTMASSMALGGNIKTKYEEYNSQEAYGRKKLEELKQKGIFYGKKGLQPWQKKSLKDAENEIIKAARNKEKLLYNADGIKKVMSNNELKQSTYTGTRIRGFSYPSKGYEFSTSNPGYVTLNSVSLEQFNSVVKDLQDAGFVIEEKKEPSKSMIGMVSSITVKPFYTEQEVLSMKTGGNISYRIGEKVGSFLNKTKRKAKKAVSQQSINKAAFKAGKLTGKALEKAKEKVGKVMHEWKEGKLHSGSKKGPVVKSQKQAVAIALSEAGLSKNMKKKGWSHKGK